MLGPFRESLMPDIGHSVHTQKNQPKINKQKNKKY